MKNLSYEDLIHELSYGREVEFTFRDVKYAISLISQNERFFTVFNPQLSVRFSCLDDLLSAVTISGQTLKEIWPHITDYILF